MKLSSTQFIRLNGAQSCVVLECFPDAAPLWRYWGPLLCNEGLSLSPLLSWREATPASLEFDQPLSVAPGFGVGWHGQSALLAHRGGQDFAQQWTRCAIEQAGARSVRFTLDDEVASIRMVISIQLDLDTDVLEIQSTLLNSGESNLDVQWLAAGTLLLPAHCQRVRSFSGQWGNEFLSQTDLLGRSQWRRENRRGRTSHDCFPGAIIMATSADEHCGLVFGAHLAWSGNHTQTIDWLEDGSYHWQFGEWLAPGEAILKPRESMVSPTLIASCSIHGSNRVAQSFHAAARKRIPWQHQTMRPRPVHLNTWEAVYFDHRENDLKSLATSAADLGVERFVLDDGWLHRRSNDRAGLGDWWPDNEKYPHGLLPLAQHVNACGMEFGLWVEPEMVNPDSDLYRRHPDWVQYIAGRPLLTGRNQLVLNLARTDVAQYLYAAIDKLLSTLPIAYLKWDMNRDLATAADSGRASYRAQVLALYALFARIRAAHPALEIESCASGGGRMDFGILTHAHRLWTSDCNDALARVDIQRGALQFFPPEVLGCHVGAAPSQTTGRSHTLAFRAAVALPGHFGLELDVRKLSVEECATLKKWIALYRALRGELHTGRVWRGETGDHVVWQAHGTNQSIVVFLYRLKPTTQRWPPTVRLPMLEPTQQYSVARIDSDSAGQGSNQDNETVNNAAKSGVFAGDWLIHHGWPMPRVNPETAMVLRLTATA